MDAEIITGIERMDFARVTAMMTSAYWSRGIGEAEVRRAAANSALVIGAFIDGRQIGYGRVISDKTRFAYLTDFYVDEGCRGQGTAKKMVEAALKSPELAEVYQWLLVTGDAHGLYKKCGFSVISRPLDFMEIRNPRPDR